MSDTNYCADLLFQHVFVRITQVTRVYRQAQIAWMPFMYLQFQVYTFGSLECHKQSFLDFTSCKSVFGGL